MKNIMILIALCLTVSLKSSIAQDNVTSPISIHNRINPELLDMQISIQSMSTETVILNQMSYIGRLEIKAKRGLGIFKDDSGIVRVFADGVEVDCIRYYSRPSKKWRKFIININRSVRVLEFYNGMDVKLRIDRLTVMPGSYSQSRGGYAGNDPSGVSGLMVELMNSIYILRDILSVDDYKVFQELNVKASRALNEVQVLGPIKARGALNDVLRQFQVARPAISQLESNSLTFEIAQTLNSIEMELSRLVK